MKAVPAIFKQIRQKIYDVSIMGKTDLLFSTDMWATRKILSRTWKGQTVVVVKNAHLKAKVQNDLKTESHFLAMTPTNSCL